MNISADLHAVQARIDQIAADARSSMPPPTPPRLPSLQRVDGVRFAGRAEPLVGPLVGSRSFDKLVSHEYEALARRSGREAGVDPALIAAVAQVESGFDPRATSRTGAAGLMQLMPATAVSLGVADPYDPAQNVRGGAAYLHELLERFHASVPLAVAAYNAGPGAVERYRGIPPYAETRIYVERVMAAYRARGGL